MKRRDLERHLRQHGCVFYEHDTRHDTWLNPANDVQTTVPRHSEINTFTARGICKQLKIPIPKFR